MLTPPPLRRSSLSFLQVLKLLACLAIRILLNVTVAVEGCVQVTIWAKFYFRLGLHFSTRTWSSKIKSSFWGRCEHAAHSSRLTGSDPFSALNMFASEKGKQAQMSSVARPDNLTQ
eukprot:6250801-Amphidinium_carterae.1